MAETTTEAAGAQAAQPAAGTTAAAGSNAPAAAEEAHQALRARAIAAERKAETLEAAAKAAAEKQMAEAGQHKELAAIAMRERDEARRETAETKKTAELVVLATENGIPPKYHALIDRTLPAAEALAAFKAQYPEVINARAADVKTKQPGVSSATPGGSTGFDPSKPLSAEEIRGLSDEHFRARKAHMARAGGNADPFAKR